MSNINKDDWWLGSTNEDDGFGLINNGYIDVWHDGLRE